MAENRQITETLQAVILYAVLAALWILLSDILLASFIDDPEQLTLLQTVKGTGFVLVTAALFYLLARRMDRRLEAYDNRYRAMFEANPLPMWIYDEQTLTILLVNRAAVAHYGYAEKEFIGLSIRDLQPPEDVPQLIRETERISRQRGSYSESGPWRHCTKDGKLLWVEIDSHSLRYEGRPARLVVARDITRNVEAEDILRLNAEVLDNSREGIMVTDRENRIMLVNRAFERITGYRRDEVIGQRPGMLGSGRQDESFYRAMWHSIEKDGYWQGEIWNRRKDGTVYPEHLSISTIHDQAGHTEKYIAVFSDVTAEKMAEARIDFLAHYDPLTGLPNRSTLLEDLAQQLLLAEKEHAELALLVLDIDRFKHINEGLGYDVGNQLLVEISRRLRDLAQEEATVYRQSGDEFTLLLPGHSVQQAAQVAGNVLETVSEPFNAAGQQVSFTASIGIVHYPQDASEPRVLLQRADSALSRAKTQGRNSFQFYDQDSQHRSLEYMQIESALRQAIANDELFLHYQAQYDAASRRICGFEALVRWQHAEWGLVSPADFIPVAEESGQIIALGQWVLRTAARQALIWHEEQGMNVPVAINISVIQFRRHDLYDQVASALAESGLPPGLLCLEITESVAMEGAEFSVNSLERLRSLGIRIAIDDFGSGYSSLNYLKRLKVDKLKIDKAFIDDVGRDPRDAAIVRSIIQLAHSLGFTTIAEGVETATQYEALREMGCDEIQGYHFARPAPVADIGRMLTDAL